MPVVGRNAAANATKNGGGSRKLRPRSAPNGAAKPRRATPTRCTNSHLGDITTNGPSMIQLARRARAPAIRRGRGRRGSTSPRELKPLKPWRPRVPQLPDVGARLIEPLYPLLNHVSRSSDHHDPVRRVAVTANPRHPRTRLATSIVPQRAVLAVAGGLDGMKKGLEEKAADLAFTVELHFAR